MAKLAFLGRLEDQAGTAEIAIALAAPTALALLLERLPQDLAAALRSPRIRIALNGALVAPEQVLGELMIADADEVAFLPPVSGG